MSRHVNAPVEKLCPICGTTILPSSYLFPSAFRKALTCSSRCGARLRYQNNSTWDRIQSYVVTGAMTFEEIAVVAGVSKQRVAQIYQLALRKLAANRIARRLFREMDER